MAKITITYSGYNNFIQCERCNATDYIEAGWVRVSREVGRCIHCAATIRHHKQIFGRWKYTHTKRFLKSAIEEKVFEIYDTTDDDITDRLEKRNM